MFDDTKVLTQKAIFEYLEGNTQNVEVKVGRIESLNGKDCIVVNYITDTYIPTNNSGVYRTTLQITVLTKDFETRKSLVNYIKQQFHVNVSYDNSDEFEYYVADCEMSIFLMDSN